MGRGAANPQGFEHWTLDRHYRLMANITLTGGDWEPIGDDFNQFTGTFNGGGFNISGLTINNTSPQSVGIFAFNLGTIENINLVNVNVISTIGSNIIHVGSVAGINGGTIRNITVSGSVTGAYNVGGVVGHNDGGVVILENSRFSGTVSGTNNNAGGIAGTNASTLTNSRSSGTVSGNFNVGGVVGINGGTLTNSISSGTVNGGNSVGGLVGLNCFMLTGFAIVQNSYSIGNVSGTDYVGGVVGRNNHLLQNSVALNQSITRISGVDIDFGRVMGGCIAAVSTNIHAHTGIVFIDGTTPQPDFPIPVVSDPSRHGADVSPGTLPGQFNNQDFWETTLGWDFTNVWQMQGSPPLPVLRQPQ